MKLRNLQYILVLQLFSLAVMGQSKQLNPPQVKVEQGILQGIVQPSGIHRFTRIPFAQPPVGELRWKAPQQPKKWTGVRKAETFGNKAMQKPVFSDMNFRAPATSEDCLYLNVWTPAKTGDKLPVLVYFYGGGYIAGDGSEYRYDGESLAQKGIVTVTVNYRLGVFGFLSLPELTKESPSHASGNYGLLDQNAALKWVKKNIAAFGGDPAKITIAGESAGSISVCAQMASPLSRSLIAGAIGESGGMIKPTLAAVPLDEAEKSGTDFMDKTGAKSLAELRAMPANKILDEASKPGAFSTRPTVDGYFLPKDPEKIYEAGEQAKVPLLTGWNSAEVPYNAILRGDYPSPENYEKKVHEIYGTAADAIVKLYPGTTEQEVIASATALGSDSFIVYSTWKWADLHKQTSKAPVYVYVFSKARPSTGDNTDNNMPLPIEGANHASEIEYALGNLATNKVYNWTEQDYEVSSEMENYFANFIKTGNPNGQNLPEWPVSKPDGPMIIMNIGINGKAGTEEHRDRYLLLSNYYKSN